MSARLALVLGIALLVSAVAPPPARAAGPETCVTHYTEGRYAEAARCFEDLEAAGNVTGDLFYDQGNAWYRAGELGKAILAWRRAALLMPRDGDLLANLDTARQRTRDEIPLPYGRGFIWGAILLPVDSLSASELLVLGALGWALLLVLASIRLLRRYPGAAPGMALGALMAVLGLGGWCIKTWEQTHEPVGVVLAEEVTLRSGRDLQSRDLLVLHEGAEVHVLERGDDWVQVGINDGPRGWLPAEAVGVVELSSGDRPAP